MEFWGDDRGQSIQVGAILLFGFLVIALTTYQTTVVPQQNAEIEYNHNQAVGMDILDLRNDLLTAGRTGRTTATTVQLGTRYPARAVFINPPPPSGRIETVGTNDGNVNVTIGNATADGDVGDYWNGTDRTFNTGATVYSPNYNEYQNAPDTGIDIGTGVVFNAQRDARIPLTDQQLIEGDRINLVLLTGNLSKGGSYATALDTRPVSSSENTIEIDSDQNVTITLATRLSVDQWEDLTSGERQSPDGRVLAVESAGSIDEEFERIRLVLKPGNYHLSISKVGLGPVGSASGTEPAYITAVDGDMVVSENTTRTVRFELRDKFNNPTGGENVTVSLASDDPGELSYDGITSDSVTVSRSEHDGEIAVNYVAEDVDGSSTASVTVTATFDGAGSARTNITVVNTDGSGTGGGGGGTLPDSAVAYADEDRDRNYDGGEETYTAAELESFDRAVNLVIAKDVDRNGYDVRADSITVAEGVTVSVTDYGNTEFRARNGELRIAGVVDTRNAGGQTTDLRGISVNLTGGEIKAGGSLSVRSTSGNLDADDSTLDVSGGTNNADLTLTTADQLSLRNTRLIGDEFSDFVGNRQSKAKKVFVGGAIFERGNGDPKEFDVSPGERTGGGKKPPQNVEGEPTKGEVV